MKANFITVFIPTYNREKYLPRLFDSLEQQTVKNFDVLVVDDGSTDNTENLVQTYVKTASFPVRYYKKKNGRKPSAYNYGIPFIKGTLTFELDSDDYVTPDALEIIENKWKTYQKENKKLVAMRFLANYHHNKSLIGDKFPDDLRFTNTYDIRYKHKVRGDKALVFLTKELQKNKFPSVFGENQRMSILYNRIGCKGVVGVCNLMIMTKEYLEGGITSCINNEKRLFKYPVSNAIYYNELNHFSLSPIHYIKHNAQYAKFEFYNGKKWFDIYQRAINKKRALILPSIALGYIKFTKRKLMSK